MTEAPVPYRILVSIGHDDASNPAFVEAVALMRGHGLVEMHAVNVVEQAIPAQSEVGLMLLDQKLRDAPAQLEERLSNVARQLGFRGRVIGHIRLGSPAAAILQTATDIQADVIVVGTHQRKGLERFFLGSVAESVVREAHCPVMVVTSKNYTGLQRSLRPDPPCADCLRTRAATDKRRYWCERHAQPHPETLIFEPTERTSQAPAPTGVRIL